MDVSLNAGRSLQDKCLLKQSAADDTVRYTLQAVLFLACQWRHKIDYHEVNGSRATEGMSFLGLAWVYIGFTHPHIQSANQNLAAA